MYQTDYQTGDDHPTQALVYRRAPGGRRWLIVGAVLAVGVVLLLATAVACRGSSGDPTPLGAAGTPATSPERSASSESSGPGRSTGPGGDGGSGGLGSADQSGPGGGSQDGGGEGDQGDGGSGEPEPLSVEVSVSTPVVPGCQASGVIMVTGDEFPTDISYQWFRLQNVGQTPNVPVPFGQPGDGWLGESGQLVVHSPQFPPDATQNRVQLRVLAPQPAVTGFVTYPECAEELGIGN